MSKRLAECSIAICIYIFRKRFKVFEKIVQAIAEIREGRQIGVMASMIKIGEFTGMGRNKIRFESKELIEFGKKRVERIEFGLVNNFFEVKTTKGVI